MAGLLAVVSALVPASNAALMAGLTNTTNTVATRIYYTSAAAITADNPRVYYKLDETSGTTATNKSGQARNGTYQGSTTKAAADACTRDTGSAATFNGSTGYVNLATSLSVPTTYSVTAWFTTTSAKGGLIAGFGAAVTGLLTSTDRVLYLTNTGALVFALGNNNTVKASVTAPGPYREASGTRPWPPSGPTGCGSTSTASRSQAAPTPLMPPTSASATTTLLVGRPHHQQLRQRHPH